MFTPAISSSTWIRHQSIGVLLEGIYSCLRLQVIHIIHPSERENPSQNYKHETWARRRLVTTKMANPRIAVSIEYASNEIYMATLQIVTSITNIILYKVTVFQIRVLTNLIFLVRFSTKKILSKMRRSSRAVKQAPTKRTALRMTNSRKNRM